jgi:hypothetical protein
MRYCEACERQQWHIEVWKISDPSKRMLIPFHCRSWRHEGECRLWKGAQDFVRCRDAMAEHDSWNHVCLTFAQAGKKLEDSVFRGGLSCWAKLRKRLTREYGKILYIQTWEVHRSGWPHVHLALSNKLIHSSYNEHPKTTFNNLMQDHAVESGFGKQGWCEPLRDKTAMAGYLGKLCRELTGRGKAYQIPIQAPKNFRRLRSSRALLPPCLKDPDLTGILRKYPLPEMIPGSLVNTGISGRTAETYTIENREVYRQKLTADGWITEGLD